jgi:TldD protein
MKRRVFLKGALASGALTLSGLDHHIARAARLFQALPDGITKPTDAEKQLAEKILAYAKEKGASYCDVRISRYLSQSVNARNNIVTGISDSDSYGIGIRVLKGGTWGFSATRNMTEDSAKRCCDEAIQIATANAKLQSQPVDLVPVEPITAEWKTPIKKNPFEVSFKDRADFLLAMHAIALGTNAGGNKIHVRSHLSTVREEKYFASSEGSRIWQEFTRIDPSTTITASDTKTGEFASRSLFALPQGKGFEYVEEYPYKEEIAQAVSEASEKLKATTVKEGKYDLVLHPTHLWLTIHESIGHPTELDRILGDEANFAGTSFVRTKDIGRMTYASDYVTVVADRKQEGALATAGYDDDGCPTTEYPLIDKGELVGVQTTREQAKAIGETKSHGESYAQGWWNVPFQRMPNVSLKPSSVKRTMDDLIRDTEKGILLKGNSSYSIDQQRYNFQFSGQVAYEIKDGKLGGMLRNVAYHAQTQKFWKNCDSICDASTYMIGGAMNDGKGEPMQSNPVSHGCPAARFANIEVINTKTQSANSRGNMIEYED